MKKNQSSKKGAKAFYVTLGVSTAMIGAACIFAYNQGKKLTQDYVSRRDAVIYDSAVDRKVTNVPKATAPRYTTAPTTAAPLRRVTQASAPVYDSMPTFVTPADSDETIEVIDVPNALNVGITKMENVHAPLADVSEVIAPFSGTELVKNATTGTWQTHNGADIAADEGAEVYAVSNGEITSVENDALWGTVVLLDCHNGFSVRYCGLAEDVSVQAGDFVVSGNLIGTVGNTADIESAVPSHLHIEVMHHDSYIDPVEAYTSQ